MADKDQFTFEDNDEFPETDLSSAFSDGEHEAERPVLDESAAKPAAKPESGSGSRTRILLIVLLLVVAGGAGAYYFMGLGGTSPSVPSVPVLAQKTAKSVPLPPQPVKAPAAKETTKAVPAPKPVTVAVPPPPPAEKPATKEAPAKKQVVQVKQQAATVAKTGNKAAAEKSKPVAQVAVPASKPAPAPQPQAKVASEKPVVKPVPATPQKAAVIPPPSKPVAQAKAADKLMPVSGAAYTLDAGSYLLEANQKALVEKIKQLGYEPFISPVKATLDMTRLRLGTFGKNEVQEALNFARTIEPGSYSAPAGDQYVVYAGTFLMKSNVDKLSQRFQVEGMKVRPEPVQVVRTLSRVRFGSFATKEDAAAAASEVAAAGLQASVVKFK
jgi:cell division septation protein DedD